MEAIMFGWGNKEIDKQIEMFCNRRSKRSMAKANNHRMWLKKFYEVTKLKSVFEIQDKHVNEFLVHVRSSHNSAIPFEQAKGTIAQFAKFFNLEWLEIYNYKIKDYF